MRRLIFVVMILTLIIAASGCHDNTETDKLATVMAVGVDRVDDNMRTYTFALADTMGLVGDSGGDGAELICFDTDAPDLEKAIKDINRIITGRLSFSHLSALVFSYECARDGMGSEAEFLRSKLSVRPQTMVAIAMDGAGEYLSSVDPTMEANPERYFRSIFQKDGVYVSEVDISDFCNSCHTRETIFLPGVSHKDADVFEECFVVDKSLVVSNGQCIGIMEEEGILALVSGNSKADIMGMTLNSVKPPNIKTCIEGGVLSVQAEFFVSGQNDMDLSGLSGYLEDKLVQLTRRGWDVLNITAYSKKNFFLQKTYEKFDVKEALKTVGITVKVKSLKGDEL